MLKAWARGHKASGLPLPLCIKVEVAAWLRQNVVVATQDSGKPRPLRQEINAVKLGVRQPAPLVRYAKRFCPSGYL